MRPITKIKTACSVLVALVCAGSVPAFADTLQGFVCDPNGAVDFQFPTSKDKRYVIPSTGRIAALIDNRANGPVGIVYNINPPQSFRFISWYYKQSLGSNALKGIIVRYCVQKADGSENKSFDVEGGVNDRGGSVGDGWSQVIQDTRVGFPFIVTQGQAVLTRLTFLFKDKKNAANNITLGAVQISPGDIDVSNLNMEIGDCDLKEKCVKPGKD